jgi:hypothetical protein
MCINKEVSLTTFLFSWSIGFFLIKRNINLDRCYGLFLLTFSSMQFIDYLLWVLYENNNFNSKYNLILTKYVIPIILMCQVLVVYFGKILFQNNNKFDNKLLPNLKNDISKSIYPKILIIYIIITLFQSFQSKRLTTIGEKKNLDWGGYTNKNTKFSKVIYFIFVLFLIYPFLDYFKHYKSLLISMTTLVILLLISFGYTSSVGSYWCWIANVLSVIYLFSPYIDGKL